MRQATPGPRILIQAQTLAENRPDLFCGDTYRSENFEFTGRYTRTRPSLHDLNNFSSENITVFQKFRGRYI
jgi:hypothetical protein